MKTKILKALALCLPVAIAACSAGAPGAASDTNAGASSGSGSPPSGETGAVGMALTLPGGAQIATVDWTIAGPNGAATVVQSGTIDVHESGGATFLVSSLGVGTGYRMVLSATSTTGGVSCEGSASFDIASRKTTQVAVQMACSAVGTGGGTNVNGTSFDCAAWSSVNASPLETMTGSPVTLTATATGPIPANLTYKWSAPTGSFASATSATTSFTCSVPGPVVVTLVVGDGPVPAGSTCNSALDTDTVTVTCTGLAIAASAPALPIWALFALALGTMGAGTLAARRRS